MKKIITLFSILSFGLSSIAQHQCGTDEYYQEKSEQNSAIDLLIQNHLDGMAARKEAVNGSLEKKKQVLTIPVVFHVIHNFGPENISVEQIEDGMRVLNEDFRRLNKDASNTRSEFQSRSVDCEIEFRLARKDPQGNCSNGITRHVSDLTYGGDDDVTNIVFWDHTRYLNIWVINRVDRGAEPPLRVLAFATLPGSFNGLGWDGVITSHDFVGSNGAAQGNGNNGRVLTHEIGHWLGLLHPFYSRRGTNGCFEGDGMDDTPPVEKANYGCNKTTNSCSNDRPDLKDMIENYMDYADGRCQNAFTADQKAEMVGHLTSGLRSSNIRNSASTGINTTPNCKPIADFHVKNRNQVVCAGQEIEFEDLSWNAEVTDRSWTFSGGTPSISTFKNPKVKFSQAGTYKVILKASNSNGSSTKTKESFITVIAEEGIHTAPFTEDVESSQVSSDWTMGNSGSHGWKITTSKGFDASRGFKANISSSTEENQKFALISPTYDMRALGSLGPILSFRNAYSLREDNSGELLVVYGSADCGQNWRTLRGFGGKSTLKSVDGFNPGWEPSSTADWKYQSTPLTRYGFDTTSNLMFKFEITSKGGNSLFIDDINVGLYNVGVEEQLKNISAYEIDPNPSTGNINIRFDNIDGGKKELHVLDMVGRTILSTYLGENEFYVQQNIILQKNGIYYLKLGTGNSYTVKKVIIAK